MNSTFVSPSGVKNKLALGSAQFGMPYGLTNEIGQVGSEEVRRILVRASQHGINMIDTAMDYGDSESTLGNHDINSFEIVTKLTPLPQDVQDVHKWVHDRLYGSLERLGVPAIYGLLLHRPEQLSGPQGRRLSLALQHIKSQGLVRKIGVSVYSPSEIESALETLPIDLIQAPFNLLDRRLHTSGWIDKLSSMGIEIHVRSVFLQGLLLKPYHRVPAKFSNWSRIWGKWNNWQQEKGCSPLEACLAFPASFEKIDRVIVGIDSLTQFDEILNHIKNHTPIDWPDIECDDELLVNPSQWDRI